MGMVASVSLLRRLNALSECVSVWDCLINVLPSRKVATLLEEIPKLVRRDCHAKGSDTKEWEKEVSNGTSHLSVLSQPVDKLFD
jgi:hypothetical protein